MKVKRKVLILAIAFTTLGIVKVKAEEPSMIKPQPSHTKTLAEVEEPSSVLTSINDNTESQDQELNYCKSGLYNNCNANLSFQFNNQPDSIDNNDIHYYIKQVIPIIKNVDSKKFNMIEIL